MIDYIDKLPNVDQFFELFKTTEWNDKYKFNKDNLNQSLKSSWFSVSVYQKNNLIGYGGILSDGVYHALIIDLIILPEYQNRGIGTTILNKLIEKCVDHKIRDVQLFSSKGKCGFYEKFGFKKSPNDAAGMQLKI